MRASAEGHCRGQAGLRAAAAPRQALALQKLLSLHCSNKLPSMCEHFRGTPCKSQTNGCTPTSFPAARGCLSPGQVRKP